MHEPFLEWFNRLPLICQKKLSRIIWLLITDDMSDIACSSEELLYKFKSYVSSADIPLRKAARMIMILSLFDAVMENLFEILNTDLEMFKDPDLEGKLVSIEEKMWERIRESWYNFRNMYYQLNLLSLILQRGRL